MIFMEERRRFTRSKLPQRAQYFGPRGWEDCLITEVSRRGLGVKFYTRHKIAPGSIIQLKVAVLRATKPIMVKGVVRWIEGCGEHCVGGIEWYYIDRMSKIVLAPQLRHLC